MVANDSKTEVICFRQPMFPWHELPEKGGNAKETARLRLKEVHIHLREIQKPVFLRICGFLFVGATDPTPYLGNAQSLCGVLASWRY